MLARFLPRPHRTLPHLSPSHGATRQPAAWPPRAASSIFTKGLRDGRRAYLLAGLGLGLLVLFYGVSIATNYPTAASRREAVDSLMAVPAIGAMTGVPINAQTLGGFLSWRVTNLMPLVFGVWSVIALSSTLAGEIRAGSYEVLGAMPISRRRIALEKVAAHLASLAAAAAILAALVWLTGVICARLPGDDIALADSLAQILGVALTGLVGGAIAFALAPFIGRAVAAGIGASALFAAFLLDAYRSVVPGLSGVSRVSWFTWLADERPLAGSRDVGSLGLVAGLVVLLLAVGVIAFERRDPGSTIPLPSVSLPGRRFMLGGPGREAFLETRPAALAWGVAIGIYAWLVALSSPGFVAQFGANAEAARLMDQFFPGIEWRTAGGMLQFLFFSLGAPFMALAGATLVSLLASCERERRLDLLLSSSVPRARWLIASGLGVYWSLAALTILVATAAALGAAASGDDSLQPFLGACVGGLYAIGLVGVGLAVFGLGLPGLAGSATAILAVGFVVFDLLGSSLGLPPDLLALSLTRHLGQPMAGVYDWPGMLLAAAVAIGGLLVGAWGLRRRDLST